MDRFFVKGARRFVPRFLQTRSKPRAGFEQPLQFEPLEARLMLTSGVPCLLVGSVTSATILAYSATSANTYVQSYAKTTGQSSVPTGFAFGIGASQGQLFVITGQQGAVEEFNASTGAYVATIVAPSADLGANQAIAIGPDGNIYVAYSTAIMKYSPTGTPLGAFVSGLSDPVGLIFGPNGNLYVANDFEASDSMGKYPQGEILEYQGPNSTSPGTLFASITRFDMVSFTDTQQQVTGGMAFGPSGTDLAGCLFVGCFSAGGLGWVEQIMDTVTNGANTFYDYGAYIAPTGAYGNSDLKLPTALAFGTTPGSPGGPAHITTLWVADGNSNCVGWYTDEPAAGGSTYGWYQGNWVSQNTAGKDSLSAPNAIAFASLASLPAEADMIVSSPGGVFGGTTTLTATLTYNGTPIPNETVNFTLNPGAGQITGTATTDANGVATLNNVGPLSPYGGMTAAKLTASFAGNQYYTQASSYIYVSVEAATPTVTVIDAGGTYCRQYYPATGTVTGVNGEVLGTPTFTYYQGTYTTVAELNGVTPFGAVPWWTGSYTVLASYPAGTPGYTAASAVADFTIAPCPLVLTATGQDKPYDGTTAATVTLSASNVQPLDSIVLNYATANFANQNAGTGIAVDVSGITIDGPDAYEYTLSLTTASTLANITPIPLTITANNQSMTTGNMLPPLTATYTGLVSGDTPSSLTSPPVLSTTATSQSGVGSYPITIGGAASSNYTITQNPGVMTVVAQSGPAQISFDAEGKAQFHNANGALVHVELTGGGTGTIYLAHNGNCDPDHIVLTGTTDQSVLKITAARRTPFTLRGIDVEGPIKAITATSVNFSGSLTIKPSAGAKAKVNLKFCQISDAAILSGMPIGSLKATQWLDTTNPTDLLEAPSVDSIVISGRRATRALPQVAGDFQADVHLTGGLAKTTLGSVKVAGDLSAEHWAITGSVGTIRVTGTVSGWDFDPNNTVTSVKSMTLGDVSGTASSVRVNGAITTLTAGRWQGGTIGATSIGTLTTGNKTIAGDFSAAVTLGGAARKVTIGHDLLGVWRSARIGSLTVKHDVNGADLTLTQLPDPLLKVWALRTLRVTGSITNSRITSAGNIRSVTTAKLLNSTLYAGVAGVHDNQPAGSDGVLDLFDPTQPVGDTFNQTAYIKAVTVKGSSGGSAAVRNSNIAAYSLGTIRMVNAQFNNSTVPFGLAANTLAKFTYSSASLNYTWPNKNPSDAGFPHLLTAFGDFAIRLF